jgi:hypothetical protein
MSPQKKGFYPVSQGHLLLQNNPNAGAQRKVNTASLSAEVALVRFEDDLLPVLQANCTKCHSGSSPQAINGFLARIWVGTENQSLPAYAVNG